MRPHAPDIELSMAANQFLLAPRDGAARLRAAILALDGVPMDAELRALWETAARRLTGQGDDEALRGALTAFCASYRARQRRSDTAAFAAPRGTTHAQHSCLEDPL